jgi:hypothetical protein
LATDPPPQRAYRAACPNCGAPVEFRSAASAFAVCSFCRSTVVREGDALRKIGESAELFDDHSPLQLGAGGVYQGAAFTLVGRLQYRYSAGTWNEWHALFDTGKSAWLSEDNGRYVLAFDVPLDSPAPAAESLRPAAAQVVNGQPWVVASVTTATLIAAQGELPLQPNLERGFVVADLRSTRAEVASLDFADAAAPKWTVGRSVAIAELAMSGLSDAAPKTLTARGIECPSCGAALEVKLSTTQSIVCHQCHAVVDLSQGVGADLRHYAQVNGAEPQIPLGRSGVLALGSEKPLTWQVVGYVERCENGQSGESGESAAPNSADDEQVFWREYLLYHRSEGFAFLVDAEDGWSWTCTLTGVPEVRGDTVKFEGASYRELYSYTGRVTYVLGEFYWTLRREQSTFNTDYEGTGAHFDRRLNREQAGPDDAREVTWSGGKTLSADAVAQAFKLAEAQRPALQRDAAPTSLGSSSLLAKLFLAVFIVAVVLLLLRCGSGKDCNSLLSTYGEASQEYQSCLASNRSGSGGLRTGGGSFGGYSSGGGHK